MTLYLQDADFTLWNGDVLDVLREMSDESVHCVVTSPPYWGLRDYGTGTWEGGDPKCDHKNDAPKDERERQRRSMQALGERCDGSVRTGQHHSQIGEGIAFREVCGKCGARRIDQQLGLEPTPDEYVARMVEVFREVRRVLRADGTCWLNLGDSYAGSWGAQSRTESKDGAPLGPGTPGGSHTDATAPSFGISRNQIAAHPHKQTQTGTIRQEGLKPKDLVGIPWRVAFALQADGWYLRSDIIWAKPNPMPESVTDRPTKAHEYVFLLSKSARYFYDADAIRESAAWERWGDQTNGKHQGSDSAANWIPNKTKYDLLRGHEAPGRGFHERWDGKDQPLSRNARSVWEIATQPYPEAHFAVFPEELARRCIAAGCPQDGAVLDPFMGSGTTALVARKLGRNSIGIELNETYCELAARRLGQQSLLVDA